MIADLRPLWAITAGLLLGGCTTATVNPASHPASSARDDRACLTGTRISSSSESCPASGRVYSDEDIRSTGATTAGDALRLLDPSITVRR